MRKYAATAAALLLAASLAGAWEGAWDGGGGGSGEPAEGTITADGGDAMTAGRVPKVGADGFTLLDSPLVVDGDNFTFPGLVTVDSLSFGGNTLIENDGSGIYQLGADTASPNGAQFITTGDATTDGTAFQLFLGPGGATGTNKQGAPMWLVSGPGTGNATGIAVAISTPDAVGSGATQQTSTDKWYVYTTGEFFPALNNAYDIGITGLRPRNLWLGTSLHLSGASSGDATLIAPATGGGTVTLPTGTATVAAVGGNIGAATATTPAPNDSDTSVATTAYVQGELGGGGKPFCQLTANQLLQPAASFATRSTRNDHPTLNYADASDTCAFAYCSMPASGYASGGLAVKLQWLGLTATTNAVGWLTSFERHDDDVTDLDADSFATAKSASTTTASVAGESKYTTVTHADGAEIDSVAAGEGFRVRVCRDGDGSTVTDSMTDTAQLIRVMVYEP